MDPISATSGLIALTSWTEIVLTYVEDITNAPADVRHVFEELTTIHHMLQALKQANGTEIVKSLTFSNGPFEQLRLVLERLESKLRPSAGTPQISSKSLGWGFNKTETKELLSTLERQKSLFSLAIQRDQLALNVAINDEIRTINSKLIDVELGERYQERAFEEEKNQKIVNWLSPLNFWSKQNDTILQRQEGTGEWMLNHHYFRGWVNGDINVLWCPGAPGTGKTLLTSMVINYLQRTLLYADDAAVVFAYFDYQQSMSVSDILASFLKQLIIRKTALSPEISHFYQSHVRQHSRPTIRELSALLRSETQELSTVFVVLDALDEFTDSYRGGSAERLLIEVEKLGPSFKLLVTSRPHVQIVPQIFPDSKRLDIRASYEDIERYVLGRIDKETRLKHIGDPRLTKLLEKTIAEQSQGMFLLAKLQMDFIAQHRTMRRIHNALARLPQGVDFLYEDMLRRIESQGPEDFHLAMAVLLWITFAGAVLTSEELQHAVAITLGSSELNEYELVDVELLISLCCGMVVLEPETGTVRLVHYTVLEYLQRRKELFGTPHERIADYCRTYITMAGAGNELQNSETYDDLSDVREEAGHSESASVHDNGSRSQQGQRYPLLKYALRYWRIHIRHPLLDFLKTKCFSKLQGSKFDFSGHWQEDSSATWTAGTQTGIIPLVQIDEGACGTQVWRMQTKKNTETFARKIVRVTAGEEPDVTLANELRVINKMMTTSHANIVTFRDHGKLDVRHYYIDMELCVLNLEEFIRRNLKSELGIANYFDPSHNHELKFLSLWSITDQIAAGLEFLHTHGELHRDMKPRNVLLSIRDPGWKIADFGLTAQGTETQSYLTTSARGTACYRAPELLGDESKFTVGSDLWALGCILFELYCGGKAFNSDYAIYTYRNGGPQPSMGELETPVDDRLRTYASELVSKLLALEWRKRPSATEVRHLLKNLSEKQDEIIIVSTELPGTCQIWDGRSRDKMTWKSLKWKRYCKRCNPHLASIQTSTCATPQGLVKFVESCNCDGADKPREGEWAFFVSENPVDSEEDEKLKVDSIKKSRRRNKRKEYLVHYENTPVDDWVWEAHDALRGINDEKIYEFESRQKFS